MGSLSKFFTKHIDLLVEAFDIDENSNLIERNKQRVGQADRLVHDLFVNEMRGILSELVIPRDPDDDENGPHRYKKPRGSDLPMLTNPVVFTTKNDTPPQQQVSPAGPTGGALGFGGGAPVSGGAPGAAPVGPVSDEEYSRRAVRGMPQPGQPTPAPVPFTGTVDAGTNYARAGTASPQLVKGLYSSARNAGFSDAGARHMVAEINRENSLNPNLIFGSHTDPKNGLTNGGVISWQGDRRGAFLNYLSKSGVLNQNGTMMPTQANLDAQFKFMANEMQNRNPDAWQYHSDPTVKFDKNTAIGLMGGRSGYIAWALDNPRYRNSGLANINRGYNIVNGAVPSQQQQTQYAQQQPGQTQQQPGQPQQQTGQTAQATFGSRFSAGNNDLSHVNPSLVNALRAGSEYLTPGYRVEMTSGYRDPHQNAQAGGAAHSNHVSGNAVDVHIIAPNGSVLPNRNMGSDSPYGTLGRAAYHELSSTNPDLASHFRWGGNFNYHGFADSMHYDFHPSGDNGQLASQYQQYQKTDNFAQPQYLASLKQPNNTVAQNQPAPQQRPTQVASLGNPQLPAGTGGNSRPLVIGDSLAVGVGGVVGDTRYAHGGWNPEYVNHRLVDQAIANGDVQGKHVILSGGASNAGGNSQMVAQHYPDMLQKLKTAGASGVTVMGVGPYSHYDQYGYNKIIGDSAQQQGVNFTGPLANIAKFNGTDLNGGVHPNDYRPIYQHIQNNYLTPKPPQNVAQNTPPKPSTSAPPPDQTASASPPSSGSSRGSSGGSQQMASNASTSNGSSSGSSGVSSSSGSGSGSSGSGSGSSGSGSGSSGSGSSSMKMASNDTGNSKSTATEGRRRIAIQLLRS